LLIEQEPQTSGSPWSEQFVSEDLSDKEFRDEFVADQIRLRIATLIRALREQPDRDWSQTELGKRMGKLQSVVSRLEDPDYGKWSLQTLLEVARAFDLPLWVDFPEWDEWLRLINDVPNSTTRRQSFNAEVLCQSLKPQNVNVTYTSAGSNVFVINVDSTTLHLNLQNTSFPAIMENIEFNSRAFQQAHPPGPITPNFRQSAIPWLSEPPVPTGPKQLLPTPMRLRDMTQLGFGS
jgi:hypothetical protein